MQGPISGGLGAEQHEAQDDERGGAAGLRVRVPRPRPQPSRRRAHPLMASIPGRANQRGRPPAQHYGGAFGHVLRPGPRRRLHPIAIRSRWLWCASRNCLIAQLPPACVPSASGLGKRRWATGDAAGPEAL